MATNLRTVIRSIFDDKGNFLRQEPVEVPYDAPRQAVLDDYRAKTQALLQATGVPVVVKDWARALNDVLRYLDSEV